MTDKQAGPGQILRTDALARVRTPPERKRELLDEFERSGLSGCKFAGLVGVKYQTFAGWVAKRRREGKTNLSVAPPVENGPKVRWLEAVVDQAQGSADESSSVLTVQFGGGARVEIGDARQVELAAALLRALDQPLPGC
jgi:hypothetical protein